MKRVVFILFSVLIAGGSAFAATPDNEREKRSIPLRDGFVFIGVNGLVRAQADGQADGQANRLADDKGGRWVFVPDEQISDGRGQAGPGSELEILPSSTLEKLMRTMGSEESLGVRLTARVTLYEGQNFIFPVLFIPTSGGEKIETDDVPDPKQQDKEQPRANDPNDASIIPAYILKRLKPERVVDLSKIKQQVGIDNDAVLVSRTGFIEGPGGAEVFSFDAFGRGIDDVQFVLLKNTMLQQTELQLSLLSSRRRYRVAGIVTRYKGQYYLLLQRAVRTYTHGNFTR